MTRLELLPPLLEPGSTRTRAGGVAPSPPPVLVEFSESTAWSHRLETNASKAPEAVTSHARIPTKLAHEYLAGLSRESLASLSTTAGTTTHAEIALPAGGRGELEANDDYLDVTLVARSNSAAAHLETMISDRLDRLAGGEDLQYLWSRVADEPSVVTATPRSLLRVSFTHSWVTKS
jgi:hypothetical protein